MMGDDVSLQFNEQYFYIKDSAGENKLRFELDGGLLKYQVYENGGWSQSQTMTDPSVVQPEDSTTLPHNPSITRIDMGNNQFRVFIQNILYMTLSAVSMNIKTKELQIDNGSYDLLIKMNSALGQKFQIADSNNGAIIADLGQDGLNLYNKPITGVLQSNAADSAVNLQQLQSYTPQFLQARAPSNTAVIKNVQGQTLITFSNNDISATKALRYNPRPAVFQQDTIPDVEQVQTMLNSYQLSSGRDAINGYAGLDNNRKVALFTVPDEVPRVVQGTLKQGNNANISTDNITEGSNLFYTQARANQAIEQQKGAAFGICPLNATQKIPSAYIEAISVGVLYSGLDAQKTSQLNPAYTLQQPQAGDRYLGTDTGEIYMLKQVPFTSIGNWTLLSQGGVTSVNGLDGVVSLDTDNILEGVSNKYFDSGIQAYKNTEANQPHELVKLDGLGHVSGSILGTQLQLEGGFVTLHDNQVDSLDIEETKSQTSLLTIGSTGITSGKKITYSQPPVVSSSLDVPHKQYVDNAIGSYTPAQIATSGTNIQTTANQIDIDVAGTTIQELRDSGVTSGVPIQYTQSVAVTDPKHLASKEYVDGVLNNFILQTGAAKQFLQATSNVPITTNGRIIDWNVDLQSANSNRVTFNANNDTFTLQPNTYRIYLGAQLKEYTEQNMVQIDIALRDTTTQQNYFYYTFKNDFSAQGGNQALSISLPYIWKFDNAVNVEVYVSCSDVNYGVYNSYIMIEEFANFDVSVGLDRITDPGVFSALSITQNAVNCNLNGTNVFSVNNQAIVMDANKTVKYDAATPIQDPLSLVTKGYVDDQINVSTMSINNIGQMFQLGMTNNQLVQVGQTVQFNQVQLNTSQTMSALNGIITFAQGFVYRVQYKIGCRFANPGTMQLAMRDTATLTNVNGSIIYITYESQDSNVSQAEFYIDLRNAVAPVPYQVVVLSQTNVIQIYRAFSLFMAEQVQIISDLYFDRIEQQGQTSQLRLQNDKLSTTLNSQLIVKTANDSGNMQQELQINDTALKTVSTSNSTAISNQTILQNATAGTARASTISTAVSNQNSLEMTAEISNTNVKSASIQAPQATSLSIGTSTPSIQIGNTQTTSFKPILYDPIVNITSAQQLATKAYVDQMAVAPTTNNIQNAVNSNSRLQADQTQLTNGTTPIDMNNQKITNLGAPSSNQDAVTKQYADSLIAGVSSGEIKNATNTNSKITAGLTEITNGTTPFNMNSQKITNVGNPTTGTDALNRDTADTRYYQSNTTLDSITAPTASVNLNSQKIINLADATAATDALNRQTADARYYQSSTTLNAITAPTASVSLNSQKIINLGTPTLNTDAATKQYVDDMNSAAGMAYMVFSMNIGDVPSALESYTSTNNFITDVVYTPSGTKGYYTVTVDSTKVFGGADYYVLYSWRALSGTIVDANNDLLPPCTMLYQKTSFVIYVEETASGVQNVALDGVVLRRDNIQGALPINALTAEQGDARYYANNRYYAFKILLGDVPFTSGSTNTVYALTINSTNVPVNQSSIINSIDWVRQTGRTDTVRLRVNISNAIINQRPYQVFLTPETAFQNAAGGPTAEWQFGDSTENFVLQTFNIINNSTPKFFIHARDISNSNTQSLIVNGLIVITEPVNTITQISTEVPYYQFTINIGDIPSGVESYSSTNGVITNVQYINYGSSTGGYLCTVNTASVFGGSDYSILLTYRSIRGSTSSADNDLYTPVVGDYDKVTFQLVLEETSNQPVQNVAIDGILVRRA